MFPFPAALHNSLCHSLPPSVRVYWCPHTSLKHSDCGASRASVHPVTATGFVIVKIVSRFALQVSSLCTVPLNPIRSVIRALYRISAQRGDVAGGARDCQWLGLLTVSGVSALLGMPAAYAGNGLHINANPDEQCASVNDPQPYFWELSNSDLQREMFTYNDRSSACNASSKATQNDSALVYRPNAGSGATSMSLGGELYVNSGRLMIGDSAGTMMIDGGRSEAGVVSGASNGGMALGMAAQANAIGGIAFGLGAGAQNPYSTAFGNASVATNSNVVAFGQAAPIRGESATALGANVLAPGASSFSGGRFAQATGTNNVALGRSSIAGATNSVSVGFTSRSRDPDGVALGSYSVGVEGGKRGVASITLNGQPYSFDQSNTLSTVSLGDVTRLRQLINMGPGSVSQTSTDAVNGSQLFAGYTALQRLGQREVVASQSMADALGTGPLSPDSRLVMPPMSLTSLPPGTAQPRTLLGAIIALDRVQETNDQELGKVFDQVDATAKEVDGWNRDGLRWDAKTGTYTADRGDTAQNRIVDLKAGVAGTDAVNKSQLDAVAQTALGASHAAEAAGTLANQAAVAAATVEAAANRAQATATAAGRDAAEAGRTANTARDTAAAAVDTAARAQETATAAQGSADTATQAAGAAQTAANAAQTVANQAQSSAANVEKAAIAAQGAADSAAGDVRDAQGLVDIARRQADAAASAATRAETGANTAQGTANTARDRATAAQGVADTAQRDAEGARQAASTAETDAEAARDAARLAQGAADTAQNAADTAQDTANSGASAAAAAQQTVNTVKGAADTALRAATAAEQDAKTARDTADTAQTSATTAQTTAGTAQAAGDRALAAAVTAQGAVDVAKDTADSAQASAGDAQALAGAAQGTANAALSSAATAQQAAEAAQGTADTALASASAAQQSAGLAQGRAGEAQTSASTAQNAASAAQGRADTALRSATSAQDAAAAAQGTADQALTSAGTAQGAAEAAQGTADRALAAATTAQQAAARASGTADAASRAASTAQQTANAARGTADTALIAAANARTSADAGQRSADQALETANAARQTAGIAQTTADDAVKAVGQAQRSADAAQGTAETARVNAADAQDRAVTAQGTANTALQTANTAKGAADAAQGTANTAKATADTAAGQLQGLGAGETVVERINGAINDATEKASNFLAEVLGGGSSVDAEGQPTAPSYAVGQVAADGSVQPGIQAHGNVGDALNALDGNIATVGGAVQRQGQALDTLGQDVQALRDDSLLWDEASGTYSAGRGDGRIPARITNLAAGTAPTDAVNKSQLDAVDGIAKAAQDTADGAQDTADQAQDTATGAVAAAARAQDAAGTAQGSADTALTRAGDARQAADNAQVSADRVGAVADRSAGQLQGLAEGETVVGRLQETSRAGQQALADALGGGAAVNPDGTLKAPVFNVTGVAPDGSTSAIKAADVGQAIEALDGSLATVKDKADKAGADVGNLRGQLDRGEVGLVRQDLVSRQITVAKDADGNRVDFAGTQGPRTLSGLQDGEISATSNEAVTGRQVNAVNQQVRQLAQQASGIAVDSRGDGSDKAIAAPGSKGVAVGSDARASGQGSVATGADATAQADRSTALGAGASANAHNSVALGAGSTADRANTVSVGARGAERQISHVAEATEATDAVNLGQATRLSNQAADRTLGQVNTYTDSKIRTLRQDVYAGIAASMAMAGLPAASAPGKSMLALAAATYEGEPAMAIGLNARSKNGKWTYSASSAGTARGDFGLNVGLGYHW